MKLRLAAFGLLSLYSALHAEEFRPWTDKTTKRQIEASMVSADTKARTVTIINKDGATFTLPVDRLVDADLAYIKANLGKTLAAPTTPPGGKPATATPQPAAAKANPAPPPPAYTVVPAKKYKAPQGSALLAAVKKERPRILMNAAGFAGLKARIAADPIMQRMLANVKSTTEEWLKLPTLEQKRGESSVTDNGPHNEGMHRFVSYGILHYVESDARMNERMADELASIARFTNWKPEEPLTCAKFTITAALGYDWFRSALNDKNATLVRKAIIELGIGALTANLKGEPLPATAKRPEPGTTAEPAKEPLKKKVAGKEESGVVDSEDTVMAAALMIAAIALVDEEPSVAGPAANLAAKTLGDAVTQFAPDGVWPEGPSMGEKTQELLAIVASTYTAACGSDFGMTKIEGWPQSLATRFMLSGPQGLFNYGDSPFADLDEEWLQSFLQLHFGNPGLPAVRPGKAQPTRSYGLNQAGKLLFHSPWSGGYTTPTAFDFALPNCQVATMRSAHDDRKAFFVGIKGGDNAVPGAQLDLGTFVVDALGVRWAFDLGKENGRNVVKSIDDPGRFMTYREGSKGQNLIRFLDGEVEEVKKLPVKGKGAPPPTDPANQPLDAKASVVSFSTTAERGVAVVDLKQAYSNRVKEYRRGAMLVRGAKPYILMQDDLEIKNPASLEWIMHTMADVVLNGNKATLTQGKTTITLTLLSPTDAAFTVEDVPEGTKKTQEASFAGIRTLKVPLKDVKGKNVIAIAFSEGDAPAGITLVPTTQWAPKKAR